MSEFLAEESDEQFWRFVDALRKESAALDSAESSAYSEATHEQVATLAVDTAADLLSPLQQSALRLSLAVRSFAPLVETHRAIAVVSQVACNHTHTAATGEEGSGWVVLKPSGRVACSAADLMAALNSLNADAEPGGGEGKPVLADLSAEEVIDTAIHEAQRTPICLRC